MLKRKERKEIPARFKSILESKDCTSLNEITHIILHKTISGIPEGVYLYNAKNTIVTTLDDDMMGILSPTSIIKNLKGNSIRAVCHEPTWRTMIEDGEVVDNRTKKEDVVEQIADTQNAKDAHPPKRRALGI